MDNNMDNNASHQVDARDERAENPAMAVQQHWPMRHTFVHIVLGQLYTLPSASTMRHLYKHCIVVTTSIYTLAQVQVQVH